MVVHEHSLWYWLRLPSSCSTATRQLHKSFVPSFFPFSSLPPLYACYHSTTLRIPSARMCLQDMHLLAERTILAALQAAGLLAGDLEAMLEARLGAVFMPHGVCVYTVYSAEQGRL